jgi:hypothetical protein
MSIAFVARPVLIWALALLGSAATAQRSQAIVPSAGAPSLPATLEYKAAISNFQPYTDQSVQSWREANEQVQRIGGWRTYAKEAASKETSHKQSGDAASDAHSGHHGGAKP